LEAEVRKFSMTIEGKHSTTGAFGAIDYVTRISAIHLKLATKKVNRNTCVNVRLCVRVTMKITYFEKKMKPRKGAKQKY
jgi:hypothetical protein